MGSVENIRSGSENANQEAGGRRREEEGATRFSLSLSSGGNTFYHKNYMEIGVVKLLRMRLGPWESVERTSLGHLACTQV